MPSSPSLTFSFRFIISILFTMLGVLLLDSSLFEGASSAMLWRLTILMRIIYANAGRAIMPSFPFPSIIEFSRSIPTHKGLGKLIEELAGMVERYYGDSSPLKENSVRTWAFLISRSIHKCTGDVISGSLACSVLISFLLSRDETPLVYVSFAIWGVLLVLYLAKHKPAIPRNNSD